MNAFMLALAILTAFFLVHFIIDQWAMEAARDWRIEHDPNFEPRPWYVQRADRIQARRLARRKIFR